MAGSRGAGIPLALLLGCGGAPPDEVADAIDDAKAAQAEPHAEAIARLTRWEDEQRAQVDFAARAPWSERAGADPFAIEGLPDGTALGLRRGAGRIVRLDARGRTLGEVETFVDATGWSTQQGTLWVVGPRQGELWRYALPTEPDAAPIDRGRVRVPGVVSLRAVAAGPVGWLALGDPFDHRVLLVRPQDGASEVEPAWSAACAGPQQLRWAGDRLLALCMLDHALLSWRLDADGRPTGDPQRVEHDGPIWAFDVQPLEDGASPTLRVALAGVEDHPLDRSDGAFGFVDSFVFVVDLPAQGEPVRRAALNVAAHGVITPKWVRLRGDASGTTVHTVGYGSEAWLRAYWDEGFGEPTVSTRALVPGITDAWISDDGRTGLAADPLLDAWVRFDEHEVEVVAEPDLRPTALRVGEALAFTGLMGPYATSEGHRSRFTCETCHHEGGADGRVHFTGREQVHATTRSLRGLFENRPHFSRALDDTMATMVDNEFDVASRGTEGTPWFSVSGSQVPWLRYLGVTEPLDGEALRRALMTFVMAYTHEPNPLAAVEPGPGEPSLDDGAQAFARHCEGCHQARLVADDPSSRVQPDRWLAMVRDGGPIVWGSEQRERTGIEPYVHADGPRVPSLRRLHGKRPYFTNGSAATLEAVLDGFSPATRRHVRTPDEASLDAGERAALLGFLRRL